MILTKLILILYLITLIKTESDVELDNEVSETLQAIQRAHGLGQFYSMKSPFSPYDLGYDDAEGYHRLTHVTNLPAKYFACSNAIDVKTVDFDGQTFGLCISKTQFGGILTAGPLLTDGWLPGYTWDLESPRQVVGFVATNKVSGERNLYILTADSSRPDGTELLVISKSDKPLYKETQLINSQFPTAIQVWWSQSDQNYHLAIANSNGFKAQNYESQTNIFSWQQTYFDHYSSVKSYLVMDIEHFYINSNEFIALANYQSHGPNNNYNGALSEIFKLDFDQKKWVSIQTVETFGAIDWEFFTIGFGKKQKYFLSIANSFDSAVQKPSMIYQFVGGRFVQFQWLLTDGAQQIKAIKGRNGEFVLAVLSYRIGIQFYQFRGKRFHLSNEYHSVSLGHGVTSLYVIPKSLSFVVANDRQPNSYSFKCQFQFENDFGQWYNSSLDDCIKTTRQIEGASLQDLKTQFHDVVYIDQQEPIVFETDVHFNVTLKVVNEIHAPVFRHQLDLEQQYDYELINRLINLDRDLILIGNQLRQINDKLIDALKLSGDQVVTTPFQFGEVEFECMEHDNCFVGEINTEFVNNVNVKNIINEIISIHNDTVINNDVQFENLQFNGEVQLEGLLNGISPANILTHGDHVIEAPITFVKPIRVNELLVHGTINNLIIRPDTVLLTESDQKFPGKIIFQNNIDVNNIQINGPINGQFDLNRLYHDTITYDGIHVINSSKTFEKASFYDIETGLVNGIDLVKVYDDVLWNHGDQTVNVPLEFNEIKIDGNLIVDGLINNLSLPHDIMMVGQKVPLTGIHIFTSNCTFDSIVIEHSINGIGLLPGTNQLDLMLKTYNQTIFAPKSFSHMHLGGNSMVFGTVNGVKLANLKHLIIITNSTTHLPGQWKIYGDVYFDKNIEMDTINNVKMDYLFKNALRLTDTFINTNFLFNNLEIVQLLVTNTTNGLMLERDLMTKNTNQIIYGTKTFLDDIKIETDFHVQHLNQLNLTFLNDILLTNGQQEVHGQVFIRDNVYVNSFDVNIINRINMSDLILINNNLPEQVIESHLEFHDVLVLKNTFSNYMQVMGLLNGIDLTELFTNTLLYDSHQIVYGNLNFGEIVIPEGSNLETTLINKRINLRHLYSDAVFIDGNNQVINGTKVFLSPITIDRIAFTGRFNGLTSFDINNWLLKYDNQTIYGNITFEDDIEIEGNLIMKHPIVNQINLDELNRNIVKVNEPITIYGQTIFESTIYSSANINVNGKVDGMDLKREPVLRFGNHQLNGHITFNQGFHVENNLIINGLIDGVNVNQLCQVVIRKFGYQEIHSTTRIIGNIIFDSPITIQSDIRSKDRSASLNGVDLFALNNVVLKKNEPAIVYGRKIFNELVINGIVNINGSVSGTERLFHALSISQNQIITSKIVFHNHVDIEGDIHINGPINTPDQMISNVDLRQLDMNVLRIYGTQNITGQIIFQSDVQFHSHLNVVNNRVNRMHLLNDFMNKRRENIITSPKVFQDNITVIHNIDFTVGKTIQLPVGINVDISLMAQRAVYRSNGTYSINSVLHFQNLEVEHANIEPVNGTEFGPRSLLLTVGQQEVHSPVVVMNNLDVSGEVKTHLINKFDIWNLKNRLVLKGENNTITQPMTFQELIVDNAIAYGKIDDVNVNELSYFVRLPVNIEDIKTKTDFAGRELNEMQFVMDNQAIQLAYYELIGTILGGPTLHQVYNRKLQSHLLLILNGYRSYEPCQQINIYSFKDNPTGPSGPHSLIPFQTIYSPEPTSASSFSYSNQEFLVISNARNDRCIFRNPTSNRIPIYGVGDAEAAQQIFIYERNNSYNQIAVIHTQPAVDVQIIHDGYLLPCFLFVIPTAASQMYCMDQLGKFYLSENIISHGLDQVTILTSLIFNMTLVASTNTFNLYSPSLTDVSIFQMTNNHFGQPIQRLQVAHPLDIHLTESLLDEIMFLFVIERRISPDHIPLIRVYQYIHGVQFSFTHAQIIKEECQQVISIGSAHLNDKELLVFLLVQDKIMIYQYKGASGFVKTDQIIAPAAMGFTVFNHFNDKSLFYDRKHIMGHYISFWRITYCHSKHMQVNCQYENLLLKPKIIGNELIVK